MRREAVDFFEVAPEHHAIDLRLANWGAWCHGPSGSSAAPMFRGYQSQARHWHGVESRIPVDVDDALKVSHAVAELPRIRARAVGWCYVSRCSPGREARELGIDTATLQRLVVEGRQMLVERGF